MAKKASGFKDKLLKTLSTISTPSFRLGFSHIDLWCSCKNFAMNRLWSGQFTKGLLFGRSYIFYGESGSGKSLMAAITAADAQRQHGAYVIWMDIEHATDDTEGKKWLAKAGMDLDNLQYISAATIEEVKTVIAKTAKQYQEAIDNNEGDDLPPIVFVVDSYAALMTESQFDKIAGKDIGKVVGDMGQKAKQVGDLIISITHLVAGKKLLCVGVQHIMDNQDGYGPKHKTTGGNKLVYMASGCLMLTKKQLKLDDLDNKDNKKAIESKRGDMSKDVLKRSSDVVGIQCTMEIIKSRVSKPFERVDIQIPYGTGLDPYSGLFEVLMQEGVFKVSSQGWYEYTDPTKNGEIVKFQKGNFMAHADHLMEIADADIGSGAEAPISSTLAEIAEELE